MLQVQGSNRYSFESRVRYSEIDHTRKLTLPGIINYFQDCSTFQSEDIGYGIDFLTDQGRAWVLTSWQIVINRRPKLGESIRIRTWACGFKGFLGDRNFTIEGKDGEILAYAHSLWVYMDMKKGRPVRPGAEEIQAYGTEPALEMEYAPRKIQTPEEAEEKESFVVRKYHIDTNEHVNNCQYVQMALEVLEEEPVVKQIRVAYKKSAVLNDIIYPKIAKEEGRTLVELCDETGEPYAVVEFQ